MKTKLVVFGIILLVMVITYGFENMLIGKVTSVYAKNTGSDKPGLSICKTTQVPKSSSLNETFTVTEGFKGNPAKFNGKCIVDMGQVILIQIHVQLPRESQQLVTVKQ